MKQHTAPSSRGVRRGAAVCVIWLVSAACGPSIPFIGGPEDPPAPAAEAVPEQVVGLPEPVVVVADELPIVELPRVVPEAPLSWEERTLRELTLREKVGQLIMPFVLGDFAPEGSPSHERVVGYIEEQGIGGVIMSVGTPIEVAAKLNDLQRHASIPLLVAADLETGAGFRMRGAVYMPGNIELGGATDFPSLMAVGAAGDERLAYEMGRITAIEARAVGIHVPFAPVLDVNNNPDNPIINVRSFGEDPAEVARMGTAFVMGIQDHGAIATGKHFPGHGDTDTDSHLALPVIRHDRARMDSVELRPFKEAIDAGIGAIMTAHISVPSLNGGILEPSTLSPIVLTTVLRDELGFDGIIFTDAMDMSAIARRHSTGDAAVRALEAGADVILMPPDVSQAIDGIVDAVESGRLSEERIDVSVRRVLAAKAKLGLDSERLVSIQNIGEVVGTPDHTAVATEIAEKSITILKNDRNLLPLRGTRSASVLSVTFRRGSDVLAGRYFNQAMRVTYPRLRTADLEAGDDESDYDAVLRRARGQALVIVGTYSSYAGSVDDRDQLTVLIEGLARLGVPHVVVSFGNPYLISEFPGTQAYMLAWNGSEASQRAAAGALLGAFDVLGRVPTRIPPVFALGDGLTIPMKITADGGR
ncbi:MAG: glycoside hydrolase family 3 protein [Gemmatimonadota bacterium]|nr:glycoside hydrolase family 3 protein [Gemmatimonadota bacterium]